MPRRNNPDTIKSFVLPPEAELELDVRNYSTEKEWLTARLDGIGASEVAGVLGLSRFQGPWSLWRRKVERVVEELGSRSMEAEAGHRHEPAIAKWFADVCDDRTLPKRWRVVDPGDYYTVWRPPLFCTLDRQIVALSGLRMPVAILELKAAWYKQARRFENALPLEYRAQVQTQMYCTGMRRAYYGVLLNGMDFRWYREDYHPRFMQSILRKVNKLWQLVQEKVPPPADFSEATSRAIAAHYSEADGSRVDLPEEFVDLHTERERLLATGREADRKKRGIDNRIKAALGNATLGVLPDGETGYSWKPTKTGTRTLRKVSVRDDRD